MIILYLTFIMSFYMVDMETGLFVTSYNNLITFTTNVNEALDFDPLMDSDGIHYSLQDVKTGMALDILDGVAVLAESTTYNKRFSVMVDAHKRFQLVNANEFLERENDVLLWKTGLCGGRLLSGFVFVNSKFSENMPAFEL